jgi:hypothetical protein
VEQRRDEFYKLFGQCIKKWADVEGTLFELCVRCLKTSRRQAAAIVYYKSPTIDSRLTWWMSFCEQSFLNERKKMAAMIIP